MDSSSNLPQTVPESSVAILAEEKTEEKDKMTISEILSKAFEIYKKNPITRLNI